MLFQISTPPYEVMVHKVKDNVITLVVTHSDVLTEFGNIIESYTDDKFAKQQGEQFAHFLRLAVESGYHLTDKYFTHPSGKRVHVSNALDVRRPEDSFKLLLENGEF